MEEPCQYLADRHRIAVDGDSVHGVFRIEGFRVRNQLRVRRAVAVITEEGAALLRTSSDEDLCAALDGARSRASRPKGCQPAIGKVDTSIAARKRIVRDRQLKHRRPQLAQGAAKLVTG